MASSSARVLERGNNKLHAPLATGDDGVLPTDVLRDILLRLSADVICRFRIVCRSWQSLTSDPIFAEAHASRHPLLVGIHVGRHFDYSYEIRMIDLSSNIIKRIPAKPYFGLNVYLDPVCVPSMLTQTPSALPKLATLHRDADGAGTPTPSFFLLAHIPSTGELKVFYSRTRLVTRHHVIHWIFLMMGG
ncbi:unnamed protein product [Urochloa humidicola]